MIYTLLYNLLAYDIRLCLAETLEILKSLILDKFKSLKTMDRYGF